MDKTRMLSITGKQLVYVWLLLFVFCQIITNHPIVSDTNTGLGLRWRLYKKEIFRELRFPLGYLYEDAATTHWAFMLAKRMILIHTLTYAYRICPDSIIRMDFNEEKIVALQVAERIVNDKGL